jgi:hypothetical protein
LPLERVAIEWQGEAIAGAKTIEVRSWHPGALPLRSLLIVENKRFLSDDVPEDQEGLAVAIVDVLEIHPWRPDEVEAACSSGWEAGYLACSLGNIRPLTGKQSVPARRKLYEVHWDAGNVRARTAL